MEEQRKYSICYGCLSMDRHVKPIKEHADLFASLFGFQSIKDLKWFHTELCWECLALLRRICTFRTRVQRAHLLLNTLKVTNDASVGKLTTLSINKKDIYDAVIEYDENMENKEIKNGKEIINLIEGAVKEENEELALSYLHNSIDDHTSYEDLDELQNVEKYENDLEYENSNGSIPNDIKEVNIVTIHDKKSINKNTVDKKTKTKDQSKEKVNKDIKYDEFLNHVTIVKNDIDFENIAKYFVKVNLNKEEYAELLEKKQNSIDYVTMDHKCELCICGFTTHALLQHHKQHYHIKTSVAFRCARCRRGFPTRHAVLSHTAVQHSTLRCRACDHLCWGRSMPVTHLKTHLFTYTCNFCSERFSSLDCFVVHYKKHHCKYICDRCGRQCPRRRAMEKHLRNHHDLRCRECDKPVGSRRALHLHAASEHATPRDERAREAYYCVECDVQFPNAYKFKKHLRDFVRHNPPKRITVPCPECGKGFTRTAYMRNHFKLYHLKKNDHYCETCDKYFVSRYSVNKHRMDVHEKRVKPRNKVCNVCGRAFHTNRILNNHMRTHTGEKPYICKYCGTSFAQETALKSHERSRHKN